MADEMLQELRQLKADLTKERGRAEALSEALQEEGERRQAAEEMIRDEINTAEVKAWDALSRYKFQMFGYWSAIWVHLNRISGERQPNPWNTLVQTAQEHLPTTKIGGGA